MFMRRILEKRRAEMQEESGPVMKKRELLKNEAIAWRVDCSCPKFQQLKFRTKT
jgi:hypothetical protein